MTMYEQLWAMCACQSGLEWVRDAGITTWDALWAECPDVDWMLWLVQRAATRPPERLRMRLELAGMYCRGHQFDDLWHGYAPIYSTDEEQQMDREKLREIIMEPGEYWRASVLSQCNPEIPGAREYAIDHGIISLRLMPKGWVIPMEAEPRVPQGMKVR